MEERISILEAKYESLEKMFEVALNTAQSQTMLFVSLVGILVPIFGFLIGTIAIKYYVRDVVEKKLEERLISLYEKNPPTFNHSGNYHIGDKGFIILDSDIKGLDQLNQNTLVKLKMYTIDSSVESQPVLGVIKKNEEARLPFINTFVADDLIGKLIYVSLTWKRTKIEK